MNRPTALLLTLATASGLVACGGGGASDRCVNVSAEVVAAINERVAGQEVEAAKAVKSKDFENVYFVAARLDDGDAVWATNSKPQGNKFDGTIQSANSDAVSVSDWPRGDFSKSDDGMTAAPACLR